MSYAYGDRIKTYREYLKNKQVSVLGIGISNLPLIGFLLCCGARVVARDKRPICDLRDENGCKIAELENNGVRFVTGESYLEDLNEEIIYKTPGIRYDTRQLLSAYQGGAVITSEMEAFLSICPSNVIAITGSDGKTTTTTLTAKLLEESGYRVRLGGNIGRPLLADIDTFRPDDFAVLELSSFQLHALGKFDNPSLPFSSFCFPDAAVITNISPNHLDWHTDLNEYTRAKAEVFRSMKKGALLVTNHDCRMSRDLARQAERGGVRTVFFSSSERLSNGYYLSDGAIFNPRGEELLKQTDILLPGKHNVENYLAAIAVTEGFHRREAITAVAGSFAGVEHRMELAGEKNGVLFYNSSIDSSPTRTIAALSCFQKKDPKNIIVILGGRDKKIPFSPLGYAVCDRAKAAFIAGTGDGETARSIERAIKTARNYNQSDTAVFLCEGWEETLQNAFQYAKSGDVVLLSPACVSFDSFRNFEERGRFFKQKVNEL